MRNVIARYNVRAENLEPAKATIAEFINLVHENEPDTIRYDAYIERGTNNFVHFMTFKDDDAERLHSHTPYCRKFVDSLYPLCEQEPIFIELDEIK